MWHDIFTNDKTQVIIAVTVICIVALCLLADASAKEICLTSLGAIGGLVTGQSFRRSTGADATTIQSGGATDTAIIKTLTNEANKAQ